MACSERRFRIRIVEGWKRQPIGAVLAIKLLISSRRKAINYNSIKFKRGSKQIRIKESAQAKGSVEARRITSRYIHAFLDLP